MLLKKQRVKWFYSGIKLANTNSKNTVLSRRKTACCPTGDVKKPEGKDSAEIGRKKNRTNLAGQRKWYYQLPGEKRRTPARPPAMPACFLLHQIKHRHRLHMRSMRKHVHHTRLAQLVTGFQHQDAGVARQGRRAARYIHDTFRQHVRAHLRQADQRLAQGHGAVARRVDQDTIKLAQRDQVVGGHFKQVARRERGFFRQAIGQRVFQRALGQGGAAFDADHFAALRGQRQGEIAQAAEQVGHAVA